jgi:hypothetical protein
VQPSPKPGPLRFLKRGSHSLAPAPRLPSWLAGGKSRRQGGSTRSSREVEMKGLDFAIGRACGYFLIGVEHAAFAAWNCSHPRPAANGRKGTEHPDSIHSNVLMQRSRLMNVGRFHAQLAPMGAAQIVEKGCPAADGRAAGVAFVVGPSAGHSHLWVQRWPGRSKRSRFITLTHAATKSSTNFFFASSEA